MKKSFFNCTKRNRQVVILALIFLTLNIQAQQNNLAKFVNPFIGASTNVADAGAAHGLGKTFPGAATPFGLVQLSPNTITGGDNGSGYSYEHTSIEGFAFTQMSGVGWYGDLGNFLVIPATGDLKTSSGKIGTKGEGYRSDYNKKSEKASAGYYEVLLTDNNIKAEMTAAQHSGIMRFTFPANKKSRIQIDLARRVGGTSSLQQIKVVDKYTIKGWMKCTPDGGGWGNGDGKANYTVYFYAMFSKPLNDYGVWSADIPDTADRHRDAVTSDRYQHWIATAAVTKNIRQKEGKHLGFYTQFATKDNEQVLMKAGISFTNAEGAKANLEAEINNWDFDMVHKKAVELWNHALGKIKIAGGTAEDKIVFYTALYHTLIDPRSMQDVNGNYRGADNKIHQNKNFTRRTIFSGWDVFRSQMPLQTIINPVVVNDMINSLVTMGTQSGQDYLERWEFFNAYTGCMIGNPAIPVIADAYAKGIRNFDVPTAYEYAVNTSNKFGNGDKGYSYESNGISSTLEYAFSESCLADLSKALGKKQAELKYRKWAQSYRNIFDSSVGWVRPKMKDGSWEPWPKEGRLADDYGTVESNPYQQGWFVPHDVKGMVQLMGGNDKVIADLTNLFEKTPENMMWNSYYNHANEPVHHIPFLFNRVGAPWLTQKWTRAICRRAYRNAVEGLVGNEDVGQMSAWYVLAASGFHPIAPGNLRYEITSPVFNKVVIKTDATYASGKTFTIIAVNNSSENIYIQSATLNGKPYPYCFISHTAIAAGGVLQLQMGKLPNKNWGKNE
ncbi:GH92 family glycosyl hydrolase [Ferruginibacter sp.]|uniref:GH92 family glycosyl hydrolase n=1 Tax=Ferruginibacter sp. TaxID=1940288 RepID=UPI0026591639|nr:GH92 family glycosyl hydrolase [Ferruginibacter sp.]